MKRFNFYAIISSKWDFLMKMVIGRTLYVQKIDLEFLKYRLHSLPQFISSKIFESRKINVDDNNKYDFFRFEDIDEIEFFKGISWIIDYDSLIALTDQDIKKLSNDYEDILLQYKLLNYQIASLNDFIDFKSGRLKITLPREENKLQKIIRKIFAGF